MESNDPCAARAMALAAACLACYASSLVAQEIDDAPRALGEPARCPPGESGILGQVGDAETGLPLPTTRLTARPTRVPGAPEPEEEPAGDESWSTEADPGGAFALCGVEPGRLALSAEFQGAAALAETVSVAPGAVVHREIIIPLGRPGRIDGRVLQGEDRAPVEGALVTLDPLGIQMLTDSAGTFGVDPVPPASYRLAIHHVSGIRVDSLQVRPRSLVRFESRLVARDVVLGSARVGPALRGAGERAPEGEAPMDENRRRRGALGAAGRVAGAVLDRQLLGRWKSNRLSQALTLVPGLELIRRCAGALSRACGFLPRLTSDAGCAEAPVYVDGRLVPAGPLLRLVDRLPVEDLESVQVIGPGEPMPEGVGQGPAECGAVLVWRSAGG